VQADLEKENRSLSSRCAIAEEQIKETNAYMAGAYTGSLLSST